MKIKSLFIAVLLMGTFATSAHAARFKLLVGVDVVSVRTFLGTLATTSAPGGGLGVEFPFSSSVGFEFDALFHPATGGTLINIPLPFRFYMGQVFSLALGPQISIISTPVASISDFGVGGGFGLDLGGGSTGFLIDVRYIRGLGSVVTLDHILALIGIRFGGPVK